MDGCSSTRGRAASIVLREEYDEIRAIMHDGRIGGEHEGHSNFQTARSTVKSAGVDELRIVGIRGTDSEFESEGKGYGGK
eukprot:g23158.t1